MRRSTGGRSGGRGAAAVLALAGVLAGCTGSPSGVALSMPELAQVADGVHRGSAKLFPVTVTVEVEVRGGRITGFTILEHRNGRGEAAEALAAQVVERQTILLDAISGATHSSKAILKAGENALRAGL